MSFLRPAGNSSLRMTFYKYLSLCIVGSDRMRQYFVHRSWPVTPKWDKGWSSWPRAMRLHTHLKFFLFPPVITVKYDLIFVKTLIGVFLGSIQVTAYPVLKATRILWSYLTYQSEFHEAIAERRLCNNASWEFAPERGVRLCMEYKNDNVNVGLFAVYM